MQSRRYRCTYCLRKLSESCIICTNCTSIRLCIKCFTSGAEAGAHKCYHPYKLEALGLNTQLCIFKTETDWTFEDEKKLLDAVETYGYGNWHEISTKLKTRTAIDCQNHYDKFYVCGVLGNLAIGKESERGAKTTDHSTDYMWEHPFICDLRVDEQMTLGYAPYRDEFEYEYCNSAERILTSVPYGRADELETELQMALVSIFNMHLLERKFRHTLAKEHDLIPLLLRQLIVPHQRLRYMSKQRASRVGFTGSRVHRKRRSSLFSSRYKRRHFRAASNFPESRSKCFSEPYVNPLEELSADCHRLIITCSHVESNRSVNIPCCISCSDSGSIQMPIIPPVQESCAVAHQTKTHQNFLLECEKRRTDLCPGEPMGAFLGAHSKSEKTSLTSSTKSGTSFCCSSSFTQCLGATSTATSDSGIGSCDSCAQSTITTGDLFAYPSSTGTLPVRLSMCRRPRSNSDSIYVSSSFFPTRSTERIANLRELRRQSESTPSLIHPVEPVLCAEQKSAGYCTTVLQTPPPSKVRVSRSTLKRRRGRPSRVINRRTVPLRSAICRPINDAYPAWIKPFIRFMTRKETAKILSNLDREAALRSELEQLGDQYRKGVRSMANIVLHTPDPPDPACNVSVNGNAFRTRLSNKRKHHSEPNAKQGIRKNLRVRRRKIYAGQSLKRSPGKQSTSLEHSHSRGKSVKKKIGRPTKTSVE